VTGRSSGPYESVVPPTCQQMDPAETPVSTTPDSQASRNTPSSPCNRHIASNPATLPPQTQTTSWLSRCSRRSATLGSEKRATWLPTQPSRQALS
jgi:hypothetical protein